MNRLILKFTTHAIPVSDFDVEKTYQKMLEQYNSEEQYIFLISNEQLFQRFRVGIKRGEIPFKDISLEVIEKEVVIASTLFNADSRPDNQEIWKGILSSYEDLIMELL